MTLTLVALRSAALATAFRKLWSAKATTWFGVAYLAERFLVLFRCLSLCALSLSLLDCLSKANRIPFVWRGHILLGKFNYTPLSREFIHNLTGQNKAGVPADG